MAGRGPIVLGVVLLVGVVGVLALEDAFSLFGVGVAAVALVDAFEDVNVLDELFDGGLVVLGERGLLAVVQHEEAVLEPWVRWQVRMEMCSCSFREFSVFLYDFSVKSMSL